MQKKNVLLTVMTILVFVTIATAQTIPPYVPTTGLWGWFPFDGNGDDLSINGNNATNYGAAFVTDRCGDPNSAASFNGTTTYFQIATPSSAFSENGYFTCSIWLKKQVQPIPGGVAIMSGTNAAGNFIWNMQGLTNVQFGTNMQQSAWTWTACPHTLYVWDHYVATYDVKIMKLYKNGVFQSTATYPYTGAASVIMPLWFGRGVSGSYYNGDIDDIGIWDRVLTQLEITALYQGGCDVIANFTAIPRTICIGDIINFYDNSTGSITTWDWNFTGGTPQGSTLQNPTVVYNTSGTYDVELIVSDGVDFDTMTMHNYIEVYDFPVADAGPDATICPGDNVILMASGGIAYVWSTNPPQTTASISVNPTTQTTYYVTVVENICIAVDSVTVYMAPLVDLGADTTINPGANVTLDAGANYISFLWSDGSSGQYLTVNTAGTFWVQVAYPGGCVSSDTIVISIGYRIQGDIVYKNGSNTPINNTKLMLTDNVGSSIDSLITGVNGDYVFSNLSNGNYHTIPQCNKAWGGINSTDALAIMKHFVGLIYLFGLNAEAGDVDNTGFVNSADALMTQKRYLVMIDSFPAGDWIFENNTLPIQGVSIVNDFYGLCYGDVNGSYTPPSTKHPPTVSLNIKNTIEIDNNEIINVPLVTETPISVAAISLELFYQEELIIIEDVSLGKNSSENVLFNTNDGVLKISWYSLESVQFNSDDVILTLKIQIRKGFSNRDVCHFSLGPNCEIAGPDVQVLDNVNLSIPKLIINDGTANNYLGHNHPNPFSSITQIEYGISEPGFIRLRIFNILGEEVALLVNERQDKGNYQVNLDASGLKPGNYFYTIEVSGNANSFTKTRIMLLE